MYHDAAALCPARIEARTAEQQLWNQRLSDVTRESAEEWRNTKCRRRGRPSGRLQAVVSQFPVVCLQRMGVCGSVGEPGSVGGSWESWWWRRMEGGDEQSWAVTPNLAVAPVASADGLRTTSRTNDEV